MATVTLERVWKTYADHVVLENLNLQVREHELVSVVGASGCGKTTFLRLLLGSETTSRGTLLIDGQPVVAEPSADRGVVFQRYSLFPHLTVLENVLLGLELRRSKIAGRLFGKARRAARAKALALLETIGLGAARDHYPAQLSGGMQQRVSIAQSIICEPKVLLLDEPFGALDPGTTADMHALLLALWAEHRMSVFLITHDLQEAFALGTRLLVFDKPRIDPHEPHRYGATITYDIPLRRAATNRTSAAMTESPTSIAAALAET